MKFINYLERISGISIYPLASFLLFGLFFLLVIWIVIRADKKLIEDVSNIPLDNKQ